MVFSSMFGVRFINHQARQDLSKPEDVYLDIDLDLQRMTDKIFLVIHEQKIYVMSGGLSFVDIIYAGDFYPKRIKIDQLYLEFDRTYI